MKVFPSMSSWVHAAKLYVAASTGVLIFTVMFWFCLFASPISIGAEGMEVVSIALLLLSLASLLAGFLLYQVVRFLYWAFLRLFWQHPPKSITPQGFRASLHSYSILTVASLPSSLIVTFYGVLTIPDEPSVIYERVNYHRPSELLIVLFIWVWLLTAAYLYQWFPLQRQQKPAVKNA
jgi:hypothetical protein